MRLLQSYSNYSKLVLLQVLLWLVFFCFLFVYTTHKWENVRFGVISSSIAGLSYLAAVYGNALLLMPALFKPSHFGWYIAGSVMMIGAILGLRIVADKLLLFELHGKFYNMSGPHFAFVFVTVFLAFLFGALLRIAFNYLNLLKNQQQLAMRQAHSELELLKSRVQPHFLFNTLNNIYYLAYSGNKRTAEVIAKLSGIMRYFVDEAPRSLVPLGIEIQFIRNYIELEQIRLLYPIDLRFDIQEEIEDSSIPPMLLMPLVENVFKHGIDKSSKENMALLQLKRTENHMLFSVKNRLVNSSLINEQGGLENLKKRLKLLFDTNFEFVAGSHDNFYEASIKIPVR